MILLVVIELRFYSSNSQNLTCHPRELEALRDFINELDSKPDGWDFNSTGDCCEWEGITCSSSLHLNDPDKKTLRITKVQAEACEQKDCPLSVLNLSRNFIFGSIPRSIFNLANLETLDLSSNELTGQVPKRLNLPLLINLAFASNKLNGSLPVHIFPEIFHMGSRNAPNSLVRSLSASKVEPFGDSREGSLWFTRSCSRSLRASRISSTLHILQHCKNLTTLILTLNFRGEMLPDDPRLHFKMLKVLVVANSRLTGSMSRWLSKSTNLELLDLSWNSLAGAIPVKLHVANLNGNRLSGTIPSSLSEMTTLEVLDLSNNPFSGSIPESLQKLTFLSMFSVANNSLSGRIPSGGHFQTFPDSSYEGNDFFLLQLDSMSSRYTRRKTTKYQ
uniref:Leucine-rich repeat-containing N-terminal plant-type domain-containing protein n=1 Tax=Brassica oleracea var. oleracea TaxID=109376 RepID=A0A0D3CCQ7_BRAOL